MKKTGFLILLLIVSCVSVRAQTVVPRHQAVDTTMPGITFPALCRETRTFRRACLSGSQKLVGTVAGRHHDTL